MKYEIKLYKKTFLLTAEQANHAYAIMHSIVLLKKGVHHV